MFAHICFSASVTVRFVTVFVLLFAEKLLFDAPHDVFRLEFVVWFWLAAQFHDVVVFVVRLSVAVLFDVVFPLEFADWF